MIIVKRIRVHLTRTPGRVSRAAALIAGLAAVLAITSLSPVSALAGAQPRPAGTAGASALGFGAQQAALYPIERTLPATFQGNCAKVKRELPRLAREGVKRVACMEPVPVSSLSPSLRKKFAKFAASLCHPFLIVRTRHDSCAETAIDYSILDENGDPVGAGVIGLEYSENLKSNSWKWGLNVKIGLLSGSGDVLVGTAAVVGILCVDCTTSPLLYDVPLPELKVWSLNFTITAHHSGSVFTTYQAPDVGITNPAAVPGPPLPFLPLGPARCDKLAWTTKTVTTQGCVFSDVAAVYYVYLTGHNMDKVAENIEIAEQTKPHHFGWYGHGKPLTRAGVNEIQNANRKAACGNTHYHKPWSCDEYPFADSYQGAFFFPHDSRIAKVLITENSTEGRARQEFYKNERLISAVSLHILDPYWVVVLS